MRLQLIALAAVVAASSACAAQSTSQQTAPQTIVAVFAHPDDETIVSPVLAKYARQGARVHVVIATDGRKGVSAHAHIPAGDSLATVRAGEARCSARELGVQPPVLLGFEDAGLSVLAPWPGEVMDRLAKRIQTTLAELRPDVVLTWGPEGGYGHADHRLTGNVVTQVFQAGNVPSSARLFYVGFTADRILNAPRWYGMVFYPTAPALLTATIPFDERDRAAAQRALACHWSQATKQEMEESFAALNHLWRGSVSFQQWRGGRRTTDLLKP